MTPDERKDYIALGHTGPGWLHIIERLDDRLSEIDPDYDINQIKQKFGGLRYYFFSTKADEMYDLVVQAEREAWRTCERCGATDGVTTNPRGRIETLCQECREEN